MSEATFGDVLGEYDALRRGAGLVEGLHDAVRVTGPDAIVFLDGLLSQDLAGLAQGDVARAMLLAPQGKLRATLWACRVRDGVVLLADAGRGAVVVDDLARFKLRVKAVVEPDPRPVHEVWGPAASEVLDRAGLEVPTGCLQADGQLVAAIPVAGLPRFVTLGAERATLIRAGARPAGDLAITAVRVESGEPQMGRDIDEKTIPQETGLVDSSVSFTKGCYLGQELVARIDSRGHVNRALRGVVITSNVLPPEGARIVADGRPIGTITSVAESPGVRAPVGLALLHRQAVPGDAVTVTWDGGEVEARIEELPLQDFTPA